MKRYQTLAEELTLSIRTGVLQAGDRLPSVRQTSAARGVSPSTVFEAYYLLEARGLVRARARSGYFVTAGALRPVNATHAGQADGAGPAPDLARGILETLRPSGNADQVAFGAAGPAHCLLPFARLGRALAASARRKDNWDSLSGLAPGKAGLRRRIAMRYLADGMPLSPDDIVITAGAMDAIGLCLQATTRPGDAVLIESPGFHGAHTLLPRLGLTPVEIPAAGCGEQRLAVLEQAIRRHRPTACWLMPNFQNPLGTLVPDDLKRRMVALLESHEVAIIEDDVYGELYFGQRRPAPLLSFSARGMTMHCSSFTKTLAPGYRIGWVATPGCAAALARLQLAGTLGVSSPAQAALDEYLASGGYDKHLRGLRRVLESNLALLLRAIARHFPAGTKLIRPQGGYLLWVELPETVDTLALQPATQACGIGIAPGALFSLDASYRHCLRMNYALQWGERAEQAIARLGALIAAAAAFTATSTAMSALR
jgi:DNA-binding transcriptional MocR family regulator